MKTAHPKIKLNNFTYGCAGHYKNRFNFLNMFNHYSDSKLSCEWHMFPTSHVKNAS